jgi:hypothetical protein
MPSSKQVRKVSPGLRSIELNPTPVFSRCIGYARDTETYDSNVFDVGQDVIDLIDQTQYNADVGLVYYNEVMIDVRRKMGGAIKTVTIRFASARISRKLLGKRARARKNANRRRPYGGESK